MMRRSFLAALVMGWSNLMRQSPVSAAVCPPPFIREGDILTLAIKNDLRRWALTNPGVDATVLLPVQLGFLAEIGVQGHYVDGETRYTFQVLPQMPPTVPWVIAAECLGSA